MDEGKNTEEPTDLPCGGAEPLGVERKHGDHDPEAHHVDKNGEENDQQTGSFRWHIRVSYRMDVKEWK